MHSYLVSRPCPAKRSGEDGFSDFPISRFSFLLSFLLPILAFGQPATATAPQKDDARPVERNSRHDVEKLTNKALPTIWLIGDSTVKVGTSSQSGWGQVFAPYFDATKANVINRAIGGRSSRTFLTDGRWDDILAELKAGDIVIMQFGHNDGGSLDGADETPKMLRARGTIKGNGEESKAINNVLTKKPEVVRSYGWYMRQYVTGTLAKGATPIVCSPVPRKGWSEDGKTAKRDTDSYSKWAREAALAAGGSFVDLNNIVATGFERVGKEKVDTFFADAHTHATREGAIFNAECVVAGIKALPKDPLAPYYSAKGAAIPAWGK